MEWRKNIYHHHEADAFSFLVILIILFGFFLISPLFFFIGLLYASMMLANHVYEKRVATGLTLENRTKQQKMFIDDEGSFIFHFKNVGPPILNGELTVHVNKKLSFSQPQEVDEAFQESIKIPFSIGWKEEVKIRIPFRTVKRGVGRVLKVSLSLHNPFGFSHIQLDYAKFWKEEILIYPNLRSVRPFSARNQLKEGFLPLDKSLYEDPLRIIGTRDYRPGDRFHHIHWKATAKNGKLLTKRYEKVAESTLFIIINVADGLWWNGDVDRILDHVAYLARKALEENVKIGLAANVQSFGQLPFLFVPPGDGREQFLKIMEILAIMDTHQRIFPYRKILQYLNGSDWGPANIIVAGKTEDAEKRVLMEMKKRGNTLFQLSTDEHDAAVIHFNG